MSERASQFEILDDAEALARRAADFMVSVASTTAGEVAVALSGGSSPKRLYQRLAAPPWRDRFPWQRTHWFWGDERFVPKDDPRSNYHMAAEAMLSHVAVPAANLHPIPTEGTSPQAAADAYERTLRSFNDASRRAAGLPLFDIVLLGLGTNGHTASLFPGTSVLEERSRWVAAVEDPDAAPATRITLTYPALESGRHVAFLVTGAEKRAVLARIRGGDHTLPAARVHPVGTLCWFVDKAAAGAAKHE